MPRLCLKERGCLVFVELPDGSQRTGNQGSDDNLLDESSPNLGTKRQFFVSLNDPGMVRDDQVLKEIHYEHPLFDGDAIQAQEELPQLNDLFRSILFLRFLFPLRIS